HQDDELALHQSDPVLSLSMAGTSTQYVPPPPSSSSSLSDPWKYEVFLSFREAFAKQAERFVAEIEKVEKWRAALTQVGSIAGLCCDNVENRYVIHTSLLRFLVHLLS
ncbi:unnamed protein product, partial [Ilex paraguariensis]